MSLLVIILPLFVVNIIILFVIIQAGVTHAAARQQRNVKNLAGGLGGHKDKMLCDVMEGYKGRIICRDAPSYQEKRG